MKTTTINILKTITLLTLSMGLTILRSYILYSITILFNLQSIYPITFLQVVGIMIIINILTVKVNNKNKSTFIDQLAIILSAIGTNLLIWLLGYIIYLIIV